MIVELKMLKRKSKEYFMWGRKYQGEEFWKRGKEHFKKSNKKSSTETDKK